MNRKMAIRLTLIGVGIALVTAGLYPITIYHEKDGERELVREGTIAAFWALETPGPYWVYKRSKYWTDEEKRYLSWSNKYQQQVAWDLADRKEDLSIVNAITRRWRSASYAGWVSVWVGVCLAIIGSLRYLIKLGGYLRRPWNRLHHLVGDLIRD